MAKYLREIAKKDVGDSKTPKAAIGGENTSKSGELNIDDLNAAPGNRDFAAKHKTQKWEDRNGNDDKVFKGTTKQVDMTKHGYKAPADQKVYEAKGMKCESCGSMYEGESCGCGKSVPEAGKGKKGMIYGDKKIEEGAKVDRMVKHIKASEKAAGKSEEKAENIAWATVNKRGMLNNKNKKMQEQAAPADTPMKLTYPSDEVGQVGRV
jgi:hypothetical protein